MDEVDRGRALLLREFRWAQGHADLWRVFAEADALAAIVRALAAPWRGSGITKVAGIEARGFLLGAAVAVELRAGFVAIRKPGGLLPGAKLQTVAEQDYRGHRHELRMQDQLGPDEVVLLVDDWAERGSQARAARHLVERAGGRFAGVAILVDQLDDPARRDLVRVTSLLTAAELP